MSRSCRLRLPVSAQVRIAVQVPSGASGVASSAGGAALHSVAAFKAASGAAIAEYFNSRQVGEVVRRMAELDEPGFAHIFVKQVSAAPCCTAGMRV